MLCSLFSLWDGSKGDSREVAEDKAPLWFSYSPYVVSVVGHLAAWLSLGTLWPFCLLCTDVFRCVWSQFNKPFPSSPFLFIQMLCSLSSSATQSTMATLFWCRTPTSVSLSGATVGRFCCSTHWEVGPRMMTYRCPGEWSSTPLCWRRAFWIQTPPS